FVKIFYIDSRQNSPLLFKFKCTKTCTCVLLYQEQSFFVYKNVYIRLNSVRKKKYVGTADISMGLMIWRMTIRKNFLMLLLKLTILRFWMHCCSLNLVKVRCLFKAKISAYERLNEF